MHVPDKDIQLSIGDNNGSIKILEKLREEI